MPSTDAVARSVEPFVQDHSAVLLANHGALAWGESLWSAFDRLEVVEQTAKIYSAVDRLGGGVELSEEQTETLRSMTGFYQQLARQRTNTTKGGVTHD